jgi:hypothetical protein
MTQDANRRICMNCALGKLCRPFKVRPAPEKKKPRPNSAKKFDEMFRSGPLVYHPDVMTRRNEPRARNSLRRNARQREDETGKAREPRGTGTREEGVTCDSPRPRTSHLDNLALRSDLVPLPRDAPSKGFLLSALVFPLRLVRLCKLDEDIKRT